VKNICLRIDNDGCLKITTPIGLPNWQIEKIIKEKRNWILKKINLVKNRKQSIFSKNNKKEYLQLKEKALKLAENKLKKFNKFYKLRYNKVSIRNQKTRWGSCSQKGNLNYNYKIILLPEKLCDYIIVHELCHLQEFNHSKKFWKLVAKTFPDYQKIRSLLKKI
jgi:predicted metal-dependent hydrolase